VRARLAESSVLPMMRNQAMKSRHAAEQCLLGSMLLALLAAACIWLMPGPIPTAVAYFIAIALVIALLLASLIMSRLVGNTRSQLAAALQGRARAEQAERELRLAVDAVPALVWSARPDGSRDFHSRRWLEFTGLSADQAAGQGWIAAVHPEDRAKAADKWRAAVAAGEPFEVELRGRSAGGEYRWFLVRAEPVRDEKGTVVKWYGSNIDIEDRKRAVGALRTSEAQWREVFEHNPVMYFIVDANGIVLSVNTYGAAQLGYSVGELLGKSVLQVFFEEDRGLVQNNVAACLNNIGQTHNWEVRKVRKDGSSLWVRENAKAVRRLGNQLILLVACEDITERKRAEEELHAAHAKLTHVMRVTTLGELTASIAHEVNQPLAAVVTNAEACLRWLSREIPNLDEARSTVKSIINDGNRAGEVIQRVRALVNKTATEKAPLHVNDVVGEVVALVQHELFSRRVSLSMELAPALPLVLADRIQLQQVILNLVINGIEAMQSLADRPRELVIRTQQDGPAQIQVAVQDCGIGIAPEDADRLFDAFFTTKSSGMGMGLSICRSIIDAHGGRLSVSGNAGPGATFQFTLPLHREDDRS
jgi:PAS domain S-box-containing protein